MSDLESYVTHKVINGHCDCMFLVNTYRWEWTTIAALIAPRPLLFANSDHDPIFPMDGNARIIARLRRLLRHARAHPIWSPSTSARAGTTIGPDLRMAHLRVDEPAPEGRHDHRQGRRRPAHRRQAPASLPRGQAIYLLTPGTIDIDQTFVTRATVSPPAPENWQRFKAEQMAALRSLSFRTFPDRIPRPTRAQEPFQAQGEPAMSLTWVATEPGIDVAVAGLAVRR